MLITACAPFTSEENTSVALAQGYIGLHERSHRGQLHQLTGVDPVRTEWCAAFVNAVLELDNIPNLHDVGSTAPLMARSFLSWGLPIESENIQRGDIVVFPRGNQGWQGHVGFFVEEQNNKWVILGGNQNNEVRYDLFDPKRAIGIRRWATQQEVAGSLPKWMAKY